MKKPIFWLIGLLFTAILLSACQKKPEIIPNLRIGHAPHDHHSPFYVAAMNPDYFKENGGIYLKEVVFKKDYELFSGERLLAKLQVDSSTGGKELIRKLSENVFDMSFGGVPAMLKFIDEGKSIHIIAPTMAEGAGLVVDKKLPVHNWDEFLDFVKASEKPVRIGFKIAVSTQNIIFEAALKDVGITFSPNLNDTSPQITLINMHGAKNLIPALKDGVIDGFVIMQPFVALAEEQQVGRAIAMLSDLPPAGRWKGNPCCALAASDTFVQNNKEVSEAITTLMLRANKLIEKEPTKSAAQIAKWLGISTAVEEKSIPTIKFTTDFNEDWNSGVDFWVESMVAAGKLKNKVKEAHQEGRLDQLIYDKKLYSKAKSQL